MNWLERVKQTEIENQRAKQRELEARKTQYKQAIERVPELAKVLDRLSVSQRLNEINQQIWGGEGVVKKLSENEFQYDPRRYLDPIKVIKQGYSLVYEFDYPFGNYKITRTPAGADGSQQSGASISQELLDWEIGKNQTYLAVYVEAKITESRAAVASMTELVVADSDFHYADGNSGKSGGFIRRLELNPDSIDELQLEHYIDAQLFVSCLQRTRKHNLPSDFRKNASREISEFRTGKRRFF